MAGISGKTGSVVFDGTTQLKVTNFEFNETGDILDDTGMSDGGKRTHVLGLEGATFTFSANANTAAGGLPRESGDAGAFTLTSDTAARVVYTGTATIGSVKFGVPVDGVVTISCDATCNGAWVYTPT